jgi:hypothetical protein
MDKHKELLHITYEQAYAMAQVCLDMHEALGVKWGDDPYKVINELSGKAKSGDLQPVFSKRDLIVIRNVLELRVAMLTDEIYCMQQNMQDCTYMIRFKARIEGISDALSRSIDKSV